MVSNNPKPQGFLPPVVKSTTPAKPNVESALPLKAQSLNTEPGPTSVPISPSPLGMPYLPNITVVSNSGPNFSKDNYLTDEDRESIIQASVNAAVPPEYSVGVERPSFNAGNPVVAGSNVITGSNFSKDNYLTDEDRQSLLDQIQNSGQVIMPITEPNTLPSYAIRREDFHEVFFGGHPNSMNNMTLQTPGTPGAPSIKSPPTKEP